jgi:flagellar protein FlaG
MSAMDTGSIARPSPISALNAPERVDTLAAAGAVKTDLAPEAAVQQVHEIGAVRFEPSEGAEARAKLDAAMREVIDRRIEIEPTTREVVYQTIDRETGEVVRQIPDEALMRLRAYSREMREKAAADQVRNVERFA